MKHGKILTLALILLLAAACGAKKTGTVKALALDQDLNEMYAVITLDDGKDVIAFPKVFSEIPGGTKWELVSAGQRVELEPASAEERKGSKAKWKIVRIL